MRVIVLGATGMLGDAVLRACLLADDVTELVTVGRRAPVPRDPALSARAAGRQRDVVVADLFALDAAAEGLTGFDVCFDCLGVSSAGMSEAEYTRMTETLTLALARALLAANPALVFLYVSGSGTDSSAAGRTMWARVKGRTENALLAMPFRAAYMMRPAYIHPQHGSVPRARFIAAAYAVMKPLYPLLKALAPRYVTTTGEFGEAMLNVARHGAPTRVVESWDLPKLAAGPAGDVH